MMAGGLAALITPCAFAQASHSASSADFIDPEHPFQSRDTRVDLRADEGSRSIARGDVDSESEGRRRLELSVSAGGDDSPLDVSISQRATLGAGADGDLNRSGVGSEVRVGRGLVRDTASRETESTYVFVASDNEAVTWRPGERSEFGGRGDRLALENRAEVGDLSAGVTYERNGVQASLAYVERSESTRVGNQSFSQDQSFTGVTVTVRNAP
jgi:hypothetical protein